VAHCIPVLDFRYIRLEEVKSALQRADEYSCLVLTSQRACEAISRVFSLQGASHVYRLTYFNQGFCTGIKMFKFQYDSESAVHIDVT